MGPILVSVVVRSSFAFFDSSLEEKKKVYFFCFQNSLFGLVFLFKADMNPVPYRVVYKHEKSQWNLALCQDTQLMFSFTSWWVLHYVWNVCLNATETDSASFCTRATTFLCRLPTIVGQRRVATLFLLLPASVRLPAVDVWRSILDLQGLCRLLLGWKYSSAIFLLTGLATVKVMH